MKIAIASGKGGTGKTTIATNLAAFISKKRKVILADLDVEEPNASIFINSNDSQAFRQYKFIPDWKRSICTNCNQCVSNCNFNAIITLADEILVFPNLCHSCYACSELCPVGALPMQQIEMGNITHYKLPHLDFIESKLDIGQEQAVPLIANSLKFVNNIRKENQLVIFDSPPGTSCPMIEVAKNSDYVILITEPTPFGLNDLILAVETLDLLNKSYSVVINRAGNKFKGVEEYCKENDISIIASIAEDRNIAKLYSVGQLLIENDANFLIAIELIYDFILELEQGK